MRWTQVCAVQEITHEIHCRDLWCCRQDNRSSIRIRNSSSNRLPVGHSEQKKVVVWSFAEFLHPDAGFGRCWFHSNFLQFQYIELAVSLPKLVLFIPDPSSTRVTKKPCGFPTIVAIWISGNRWEQEPKWEPLPRLLSRRYKGRLSSKKDAR